MKIFLGISGSIAAYKSVDFLRALLGQGHEVEVCLSDSARNFVGVASLETFLKKKVLSNNLFDLHKTGTEHIEKARWADLCLIYGATANTLAKITHGFADDFISTQILASTSPLMLVPAMNSMMWNAPATRANIEILKTRGTLFVGPIGGKLACGEEGLGHIADHDEIVDAISQISYLQKLPKLSKERILITLGSMSTPIDPARKISNSSSGKSGLELARALRAADAQVTLLCGHVSDDVKIGISSFEVHSFTDPKSYADKLFELSDRATLIIANAAVLDFEVEASPTKISRKELSSSKFLTLPIRPVPDIIKNLQLRLKAHQKIISFGLEDGSVPEILERAQLKLKNKGNFALIANRFSSSSGPHSATNEYWILKSTSDTPVHIPNVSKSEGAKRLVLALQDCGTFLALLTLSMFF